MFEFIEFKKCGFLVSQNPFNESLKTALKAASFDKKFSIVILSYNAFSEIDLEDEIDGVTECLGAVSLESAKYSSTIFCGVTTHIMGLKHISVAVAHKGQLVDLVDRTSNLLNDEFNSSEKIKIFAGSKISVGVLVDSDCLSVLNWQKTAPNCDVVLCLIKGNDKRILNAAESIALGQNTDYIIVNDNTIRYKN